MSVVPFLRQFAVALSPLLASFSNGGAVTFPSLLIQQIKTNTTIEQDVDTISWIGSIYGLSGIPAILMPMISQRYGRKRAYLLACSLQALGWMCSLLANNTTMIFISESFHGLATNCVIPIMSLSVTEMVSPKYRVLFIQMASVCMCLGMALGGILGRFYHFKTISLVMLVPSLVGIVIGITWPESPPWLACKGKYDKCQQNFIWLRGTDDVSNKELNELLAQRESYDKRTWRLLLSDVSRRDFYMPSLHIFMLMCFMYWSGGDVILIYFMELVKRSTHSQEAVFYSTIVMYSIVFLGAILTNVMAARFRNKTVLFFSASGVTATLAALVLVSILQTVQLLSNDSLVIVYILIIYTVFNSLGLNSFVFLIGTELMPVKHRSLGGALYIMFNCILYSCSQKLSPYLLYYLDMWCLFVLFLCNALLCGWFVWRCVPETRGRTLTEIEHFYNNGRFADEDT